MKFPFVTRRYAERLESEIAYRDALIKQLMAERDRAQEQSQRATDELIIRLGCAPVTPVTAEEVKKRKETSDELEKIFNETMAGVDAETRMLQEEGVN